MHYNEIKCKTELLLRFISGCLPILFWCLLIFSFETPLFGAMTVLSAAIHELGHETYIFLRTGKLRAMRGVLHGLKITCSEASRFSYSEEAFLYASGPLANLLVALLYHTYSCLGSYAVYFAVINLTTAASNLVPIKGYDGHGILCAILQRHLRFNTAQMISNTVSSAFTVALCITSLYLIDRFGESYWIFFVFLLSLISSIAQSLKNANYEKERDFKRF